MGKVELTEKQKNEAVRNYCGLGMSQKNSGKSIGVGYKIVQKILREKSISLRKRGESRRKFNINKNFFLEQSRDMSYVLGLLASDGCVASSKNLIYIELQRGDRELLEKVNVAIGNERPVKDYTTSNGYENSKIYFYSEDVKTELKKYKIIPNKTYSPDFGFPTLLSNEFLIDYIRGFFDGDGCVKDTNGTPTWEINSTNLELISGIEKHLKEKGVELSITEFNSNRKVPMYRIYCYGQEKCQKIYNLLYRDTDLFLKRKKEKFKSLLK